MSRRVSPLNFTVALGRLRVSVELLTAFGDDAEGAVIRAHAVASIVRLLVSPIRRTAFADAPLDDSDAPT